MADKYDGLKLENQICFPLYACSREIIKKYKPFLDEIGLTYTQYITMMVMWEHEKISAKEMGKLLYLDSGTLTPVLKKLEKDGYVKRKRNHSDERILEIEITEKGRLLKEDAVGIPEKMSYSIGLNEAKAIKLYTALHKFLDLLSEDK